MWKARSAETQRYPCMARPVPWCLCTLHTCAPPLRVRVRVRVRPRPHLRRLTLVLGASGRRTAQDERTGVGRRIGSKLWNTRCRMLMQHTEHDERLGGCGVRTSTLLCGAPPAARGARPGLSRRITGKRKLRLAIKFKLTSSRSSVSSSSPTCCRVGYRLRTGAPAGGVWSVARPNTGTGTETRRRVRRCAGRRRAGCCGRGRRRAPCAVRAVVLVARPLVTHDAALYSV